MDCNVCGNRIKSNYYHRHRAKTSYGFILVKIVDRQLKVLLIQRRYTISFVAFVIGRYTLFDFNYILQMFGSMTRDEKELIKNETFQQLWDRIWSNSHIVSQRPCLKKKYQNAKERYSILQESEDMFNLDNLIQIESKINTPDWSFPKGRKDVSELHIDCAIREVKEETGLEIDKHFVYLDKIFPLYEKYIGTDGLLYKGSYYLGLITTSNDLKIDPNNEHQRAEVGDIGLFTLSEALTLMRSNPKRKEKIFNKLKEILQTKYPEIVQSISF